jgi:carbamoyltransferase
MKVKFRESFRPFAPIVMREHLESWFEMSADSPYMLLVAPVAKSRRVALDENLARRDSLDTLNIPRSVIPAVTHVDYSARVQTVDQERNPRLYQLLSEFYALTGCPVLVNTSFNIADEPIVCTPEDAYRCFMHCNIDALAVGRAFLLKSEQPLPWSRGIEPVDARLDSGLSDHNYTIF